MSGEYLATRLKKVRDSAGLTQRELAGIWDVDRQTIINWEHGKIPNWGLVDYAIKALEAETEKKKSAGN